jgi:hypothetical protein
MIADGFTSLPHGLVNRWPADARQLVRVLHDEDILQPVG